MRVARWIAGLASCVAACRAPSEHTGARTDPILIAEPIAWSMKTPTKSPGKVTGPIVGSYHGSTVLLVDRPTGTWSWDGTNWTLASTDTYVMGTTARIVDTGTRTFAVESSKQLEWNGSAWKGVGSGTASDVRGAAPFGGKALVVGYSGSTMVTSLFDGSTWTTLPTTTTPDCSSSCAMGRRGPNAFMVRVKTGLWEAYEFAGTDWVKVAAPPVPLPSASSPDAVFSIATSALVVDDKYAGTGTNLTFWEFDGAAWAQRTASPSLPYSTWAYAQRGAELFAYKASTGETWTTATILVTAGGACTVGTECVSGFCESGVCCDVACTGTCRSCRASKTGLAEGVCGNVKSGTDPDDECAVLGVGACQTSGFCGAGVCDSKAGVACDIGKCVGNAEVAPATCQVDGTCGTPTSKECAPFICSGSKCLTSCTKDADCVTGSYCDVATSKCKSKTVVGAKCTSGSECPTGFCVDGVCCESLCGSLCSACSRDKKGFGVDGVCEPIAAGTDPDDECPATAPSTCGTTGSCNGAGACARHASGVSCGTSTCTDGKVSGKLCDGAGKCVDASTSVPCFPYVLCGSATSCATSCATDKHCVDGYYCDLDSSTCAPARKNGATCNRALECASGFCVDGTCCDTGCTGQCEACNVEGRQGICSAVTGAPVTGRPACKGMPGSVCAGHCDGANRATCTYPSDATVCSTTCGGAAETVSLCGGDGSCQPGSPRTCGAYACAGDRCATSCRNDADCAAGNVCGADGHCGPSGASCVDEHSSKETASGAITDCAPYRCGADGRCVKQCSGAADCFRADCDTATKLCVSPAAPTADEGGCSMRTQRTGGGASAITLLVAALVGVRRRRGHTGHRERP